ncbi:hypothetical protein HYH03_003670 [Edaphochlamys debaryana]|uniref:Uncharacterized protein n=1 Tax=Edaphochlamys debaryana TaxID=47281 RepID=A0A835YCQ2_9CHLO|nr:hypothetical protein HYH03_003670 [Edaphochlamys debaryana]|eukprot:KAG2498411.1 hypothetical protein HYH03_003670 [Edaphochlamys debaryana]
MSRKLGRYSTAEQALQGVDVKGKVAVVTGGTAGIGVETCKALAKAGARVYLCARSEPAAREVIKLIKSEGGADVHFQHLDLCDLASVTAAAEALLAAEPGGVHMLILNAGVMACPLTRTQDGLELQTGANHVAHFHFTSLLLPALKAHGGPARVVSVASSAHSFGTNVLDDLNWEKRKYGPWIAYGQSKLANVLFAKELARRLEGTPVKAFSLHPGIIFTQLQRHQPWPAFLGIRLLWPFSKRPDQGAATSVYAATAPELEGCSGAYLADCKVSKPSALGQDAALATGMWGATEALLQRALAGELKRLAPAPALAAAAAEAKAVEATAAEGRAGEVKAAKPTAQTVGVA